jgi:tetratricopeptide (TPR) repeat protein
LWLFRLTLLLLPFLLLGLLEVSLRLGGYGYNPKFFRRLTIGGQEFFVQNEDFSLSFFPRELVRNPGPLRFPVHKAPGTFRIFMFGESAAMGDPAQSFAPARYLEMMLREKYPGTNFEVINVAFTAINSHVILPIARECAGHEGNLWIIYMGNNEMVGPFGAATVFGRRAAALPYVRLVTAVRQLHVGQWVTELGRRFTRQGTNTLAWGGMGMFLQNQIPPDSPLKETVDRNFGKNLDDIVRAGVNSGVKVLLNTVAVNLKDCPPFASMTAGHLEPADRVQFDQLYTNGIQAASQKAFAEAASLFEQAARLDATSADLQFHWAECLLAQTNLASAREHFQLACDNDALPFRTDSRLNAAIRVEQKKRSSPNLILFDAATALGTTNGTGLCGNETFFEHVHFDFDGRYRLARAWAEQIEPLLPRNTKAWISQEICEQMMGMSDWNRAQVIHFMVERMQMPPLSNQAGNSPRRDALEARINQLRAQMNANNAAEARKKFLQQLQQRPDDFFLRENFAVFLEVTGEPAGAVTEWQHFRELLPQDSLGYYQAGRLLIAQQQQFAEAEALLRTSLAIRPSRTEAWIELGNALALQKKYPEALEVYSSALTRDPQNAQTLLRKGKVLANMSRHAEAMENYRASIRLNPADGLTHYELAVELLSAHEIDAAGKEFGEAARLTPDRVAARFNYGAWLMKQSNWDGAQREFEAVVRLEPGNVRAQKNLAALQQLKRNGP